MRRAVRNDGIDPSVLEVVAPQPGWQAPCLDRLVVVACHDYHLLRRRRRLEASGMTSTADVSGANVLSHRSTRGVLGCRNGGADQGGRFTGWAEAATGWPTDGFDVATIRLTGNTSTAMWVPDSAEQIEGASVAGDLPETSSFDAKRELPATPKKNADLATDVAAMAMDGGVLLYGVAEDEHGRPTIPAPFPLVGGADRIGQIVSTGIAEVPYIDVREYPRTEDPSTGYIAVLVPQSPRAPHQVTIGGNLRFYGRGAKGNRPLTEGEVARLYERRQSWAVDRERVLAEVIEHAPVAERVGLGYIHAFVRPVVPDLGMFERATEVIGSHREMHQRLLNSVHSTTLRGQYGPSLEQASHFTRRGADEWRLSNASERYDDLAANEVITSSVFLSINIDGRGALFCGRATDTTIGSDTPLIIEVLIAGNLEAFFASMAAIYEAAGYHGHLDVGVAITGIQGARSERRERAFGGGYFAYSAPRFSRTDRIAAGELAAPADVAHKLLRHFYEATTGIDSYNPFTQPSNR